MDHARKLFWLLILLAAPAWGQEALGRLFSSADERAALDRLRKETELRPVKEANVTTPRLAEKMDNGQITLDGFVHRKNGKATTWINQRAQDSHEMPHAKFVSGNPSAAPTVRLLLQSGKIVKMKPGQTFDIDQNKIREGYEAAPAGAGSQ